MELVLMVRRQSFSLDVLSCISGSRKRSKACATRAEVKVVIIKSLHQGSAFRCSGASWLRKSRFLQRVAVITFALISHFALLNGVASDCAAQTVIDKWVETVNAGIQPDCKQLCLITYSDILWQLALQPGSPLDNPGSDELNRALRLLTDQRLILQEAQKLPTIDPTVDEIKQARDELVKQFLPGEFQERSIKVGLTSEKLDEIVEQRLRIEKYLDFRFRNFVLISQKEITDYYNAVYVPRLRARGQIVPKLEEARTEIESILTEAKIESDTDAFLDSARERAEIVMLSAV